MRTLIIPVVSGKFIHQISRRLLITINIRTSLLPVFDGMAVISFVLGLAAHDCAFEAETEGHFHAIPEGGLQRVSEVGDVEFRQKSQTSQRKRQRRRHNFLKKPGCIQHRAIPTQRDHKVKSLRPRLAHLRIPVPEPLPIPPFPIPRVLDTKPFIRLHHLLLYALRPKDLAILEFLLHIHHVRHVSLAVK
jgi:hypothetical protein